LLEAEREAILGVVDLGHRSVIDVGTWNGYFAFEAKRAGAGRVIATDSFVWRSPEFRGREAFEIARECLNLDVEAKDIDPTESPGDVEPVDAVLFLGVFYHMIDPIMVLQKVASLAKDLLVIETHQDLLTMPRPAMAFYPGTTLNNDASNWWGPNPECLTELLATVDFRHVFYQWHPRIPRRGIYHAFRSIDTARRYLRRSADNVTFFDLGTEVGRCAIFGAGFDAEAAANELAKVVAERDAARAEIAALRGSTSWSMTAPLRTLSSIVRPR
jgi:tRNA (mo5U34)-methyltransferase